MMKSKKNCKPKPKNGVTQEDIDRIESIVKGYMADVKSGKVLACRFVKLAVDRQERDLKEGPARNLEFNKYMAARAVKFFSFLKLWKGKEYKGKEFILGPHRAFFTWVLMGWYRADGTRRFRMAYDEEARKGAKAEWIENEIPTPDGFKRMADIHPGDYVFGSSGKPIMVIDETETMNGKDCMAVSFSTGEKIIVSENHLWEVNRNIEPENNHRTWTQEEDGLIRRKYPTGGLNALQGKLPHRSRYAIAKRTESLGIKKKDGCHNRSIAKLNVPRVFSMPEPPRVLSTRIISETLRYGSRQDLRYSINVAPAIITESKALPIPPYFLGVWLGDGESKSSRITIGYEDLAIIERIREEGLLVEERKSSNVGSGLFYVHTGDKKANIRGRLNAIGVLSNKHIPRMYFRAEYNQRITLLNGLMDSDGHADKRGHCSFTNCNKTLAHNVMELLATLGIKATINARMAKLYGRCIRDAYKVDFVPAAGIQIFNLKRKQDKIKARTKKTRFDTRMITSVECVPSVPVRCITVDSPDGLYLTGKSFIPTHNSTYAGGLGSYFFVADGEQGAEIYCAAVKREQARIVWQNIKNLLKTSGFADKVTFLTHNLSIESTNSKCEPLASDSKSLDGLDTHFASLDELHAHPTREVYDLIVDSIGARSQPLILIITTSGFNQTGICYEMREYLTQILKNTIQDDSFFGIIFTLDTKKDWPDLKDKKEKLRKGQQREDDWTNEDVWVKAAPGLLGITESGKRFGIDDKGQPIPGYMTKLEDMRDKCRIAKQMPSAQNNFLTKRLNIWCVIGSTLILMADGSRKRADAVKIGDLIVSFDEKTRKLKRSKITGVYDNGVHDVVTITTVRGREITTTLNHPFWTRTDRWRREKSDWILAGNLKMGDKIGVALNYQTKEGGRRLNREKAQFIGIMVGDGSCHTMPRLTNTDSGVIEFCSKFAKKNKCTLDPLPDGYHWDFHHADKVAKSLKMKPIKRLLKKYRVWGKDDSTKRVPDAIFKGGRPAWIGFLSGYIDTDGHIAKTGIIIASCNKELLMDCQDLIALLGAQSIVKQIQGGTYHLGIFDSKSLKLMAKLLTLSHTKKNRELEKFRGFILSYDYATNFDAIKSIKYPGQTATIGIEIEDTHTHITNGLITHNTQQENRWLDLALWDQNNIRPVTEATCASRTCYGGIDLSAVSDLTVWVMLFPDTEDKDLLDILIRVWCPEARLFDTRNKYREQYQAWKKRGYLITTEGDAMDYDFIRAQIAGSTDKDGKYVPGDKDRFDIQSISVDRGFQGYEFSQKLDQELGGDEKNPKVIACGMGWVSMNGPCQEVERLLLLKKLNHGGNPILRWMADNVAVKINPTGGGKSPNKATSQGKIDGIIGILLGLDRKLRIREETGNIYDQYNLVR